jgi:hypothetical protein
MTDYRDPNDPIDPLATRRTGFRDMDAPSRRSSWGWIIGGLAVVLLLFVFFFNSGGDRTASNTGTSPTVTGQNTGSAARTPAAPPAATPRPTNPDTNTGTSGTR